MRLFIAINFSEKIKRQLAETIRELQKHAIQGSFTRKENLHLTLVFIGETQRLQDAKQAIEYIQSASFALTLEGFGRFKRNDGDIYWIGMNRSDPLADIQRQLCNVLTNMEFEIDRREFTPHLTLGRRVMLTEGFNREDFAKRIPPTTVQVERISLMKSERINGKLIYTEVYAKRLDGAN